MVGLKGWSPFSLDHFETISAGFPSALDEQVTRPDLGRNNGVFWLMWQVPKLEAVLEPTASLQGV